MNRSILIVICDFLLVSLLAFSTVDINKVADEGVQRTLKVDISTNQIDSGKDLAAVMRLALDEERRNRDQLLSELAKDRETTIRREQEVQKFQRQLQAREEEALRLQQQQANLQQQVAVAKTDIERLNQQLQSSSTETLISREKLAAMEAEMRKQSEHAAALQQQLTELSKSNQAVLAERQQLSAQLQVAQVEKRAATEEVARMTDEVKVERAEKAKLVEGMKTLASNSSQLAEEIRQSQPLAPNTIFNEFVTNRVEARFNAVKSGLFGTNRRKETETVLVTNGTNTFALCHVQDTPLTFWDPGTDWEELTGTLDRNPATCSIRSLYFSLQDPRVVLIPVTAGEVLQLGCKVYRISSDPYKFQDAVIAGTQEAYYGECRFEIDLSTPNYVKLDRNFLKGLFGKFNPSRGDLVFSKTGEVLGIMANSTYCLVIHNFDAAATFRFGDDVRTQHTGVILSQLYAQVAQFPLKLQ
jgi:regulator of replication initiation timing